MFWSFEAQRKALTNVERAEWIFDARIAELLVCWSVELLGDWSVELIIDLSIDVLIDLSIDVFSSISISIDLSSSISTVLSTGPTINTPKHSTILERHTPTLPQCQILHK